MAWFGYLWAGHCVLRGLIAHYAYDIEQILGWRKILTISAVLPILGFTGMGMLSGWAGIFCAIGLIICRGLSTVVFYDALNKRVDSDFRATVNSLVSLGVRGAFILTGPLLGLSVDNIGVNATLLSMAGLMTPVIALVLFFLARTIRQEEFEVNKEEADLEKQQATDPVGSQQPAT